MQDQQINKVINPIEEDILIVGGGPCGGFLGYVLAKEFGYSVRIIDSLPDLRKPHPFFIDRSNNFTLFQKGIKFLEKFGLKKDLRQISIPIDKKCMHTKDSDYDCMLPEVAKSKQLCYLVGRKDMINLFSTKLEETGKGTIEFNTKVQSIDLEKKEIVTCNRDNNQQQSRKFKFILGADGVNSQIRKQQENLNYVNNRKENYYITCQCITKFIDLPSWEEFQEMVEDENKEKYQFYHNKVPQKYKDRYQNEFFGQYKLNSGGVHIWPGVNCMAFGIPELNHRININMTIPENEESLKTLATYYKEVSEEPERINLTDFTSYESLKTEADVEEFVLKNFPHLAALIPNIVEQLRHNYTYVQRTTFTHNWYHKGTSCIFGEAAHSMTSFSGTGLSVIFTNINHFIELIRKQDKQMFLQDENTREKVFKEYFNCSIEDTREAQRAPLDELIFPGILSLGQDRSLLYNKITSKIEEMHSDIFQEKIHMAGFTKMTFKEVRQRMKIYYKIVCDLMKRAKSIDEINFTGIREVIIQELELNGINPIIQL